MFFWYRFLQAELRIYASLLSRYVRVFMHNEILYKHAWVLLKEEAPLLNTEIHF